MYYPLEEAISPCRDLSTQTSLSYTPTDDPRLPSGQCGTLPPVTSHLECTTADSPYPLTLSHPTFLGNTCTSLLPWQHINTFM